MLANYDTQIAQSESEKLVFTTVERVYRHEPRIGFVERHDRLELF